VVGTSSLHQSRLGEVLASHVLGGFLVEAQACVHYGAGVARNTATRVSKLFGSWKEALKAS
jgi:hypothetical protein